MNPFNFVKFENGVWQSKYEHRTLKSPEKNYGTGTTIFWVTSTNERDAVVRLMNYCFENGIEYDKHLVYREYEISPAELYTRSQFQFVHKDYDGHGDHRLGYAQSIADCKKEIDDQIFERDLVANQGEVIY